MTSAPISSLTDRFGSPLYVYELSEPEAAAAGLRQALPQPSTLYYSLKANPHPLIARALHKTGCHAEISSEGELTAALAAGFAATDCLYTGPGKTRTEISRAIAEGVVRFSVESAGDYRRVAAAAAAHEVTVDCLLRLNTSHARGAGGLRMTGTSSQFGTDSAAYAADPAAFAPLPGARLAGAHFFAMSNARDTDDLLGSLSASVVEAARLRSEAGLPLELLDLGGGFAAPYAGPGERPDYRALREPLEAVLDRYLPDWRHGRPRIAFESGRYLVGGAGRLVCTVGDIKTSHGRDYIVLDTGIHHLGGLSGLGRLLPMKAHPVAAGHGAADGAAGHGATGKPAGPGKASLVGPLCTPADVLAREAQVDGVAVGDLVEIPNVGAYGLTASLLGFLGRPVAGEVVLRRGTVIDASRLELRRTPLAPPRAAAAPGRSAGSAEGAGR
ncbi:type III PLP-dependent enzyme [Streptomyces sp. NPDC048514]|uniref:type III PLP-dependent enzyme n=1 Tax=Streptomyces sp. NPDC048514 TaxID=3365564 RepID=UPI0037100072